MAAPQNANIHGNLTFFGNVQGGFTIQSQGIAGDLTMQFPNIAPSTGQALVAQNVVGNIITCGWSNIPGSNVSLSQLTQSGATSGQVIEWNGSAWAPASAVPGSGTVTSVALSVPAFLSVGGSPITGSGTLAVTLATQTANTVFAGPASAGPTAPTFRALVSADIGSGIVATGSLTTVQGNGTKVQLSTGSTTSGNVVTYDANGNTVSSGTALTALAPLASPTFTGTVTTGIAHLQGTGARGVLVNLAPGPLDGIMLWSNAGNSVITVSDAASPSINVQAGAGAVNVQASTSLTLNAPQNQTVLTNSPSNGDNSNAVATTSYVQAAAVMQRTTVIVSSAEILALHSSPKTLIAAPGAGKFVYPISIMIESVFVTTPYSNVTGQFGIGYDGNNVNVWFLGPADQLTAGNSQVNSEFVSGQAMDNSVVVNQPLLLGIANANPTLGDSTLKVTIYYDILTA